jgi:hypothetical protein
VRVLACVRARGPGAGGGRRAACVKMCVIVCLRARACVRVRVGQVPVADDELHAAHPFVAAHAAVGHAAVAAWLGL